MSHYCVISEQAFQVYQPWNLSAWSTLPPSLWWVTTGTCSKCSWSQGQRLFQKQRKHHHLHSESPPLLLPKVKHAQLQVLVISSLCMNCDIAPKHHHRAAGCALTDSITWTFYGPFQKAVLLWPSRADYFIFWFKKTNWTCARALCAAGWRYWCYPTCLSGLRPLPFGYSWISVPSENEHSPLDKKSWYWSPKCAN